MSESAYGPARSSLRDTAKWLVTTLSALGAVLATGISLSGLGNLSGMDLLFAAVALGVVAIAILAGIWLMVRLLTTSDYYLSDVEADADLRERIEKRTLEIMPPAYPTIEGLVTAYRVATLQVRAKPNDNDVVAHYNAISAEVGRITDLAAFLALARQTEASMRCLGLAAIVAFFGLGIYSVLASNTTNTVPTATGVFRV